MGVIGWCRAALKHVVERTRTFAETHFNRVAPCVDKLPVTYNSASSKQIAGWSTVKEAEVASRGVGTRFHADSVAAMHVMLHMNTAEQS